MMINKRLIHTVKESKTYVIAYLSPDSTPNR